MTPKALEYLEDVFGLTTYSTAVSVRLIHRLLVACNHITEPYLDFADDSTHDEYILMCQLPIIANNIEWGTSIRYPWWENTIKVDGLGETWPKDRWLLFLESTSRTMEVAK